jgi:hypothetical protein
MKIVVGDQSLVVGTNDQRPTANDGTFIIGKQNTRVKRASTASSGKITASSIT